MAVIGLLVLLQAAAPPAPLPVCAHVPTQAAINACADRRDRQANARMAAQYRATLAQMRHMDAIDPGHGGAGPGYAAALLAAQRAWLAFRDAECRAEGMHFAGGSAQPSAIASCRTDLSGARTAQLAALAK